MGIGTLSLTPWPLGQFSSLSLTLSPSPASPATRRAAAPSPGRAGWALAVSVVGRQESVIPSPRPRGSESTPPPHPPPSVLLRSHKQWERDRMQPGNSIRTAGFGEGTPLTQRTSSLTSSASTAGLAVPAWHLYAPGLLCPGPCPVCVNHSGFLSRVWLAWSLPG